MNYSRMTTNNAQAQLEYLILFAIICAAIIWVYEQGHRDIGTKIADKVNEVDGLLDVPAD